MKIITMQYLVHYLFDYFCLYIRATIVCKVQYPLLMRFVVPTITYKNGWILFMHNTVPFVPIVLRFYVLKLFKVPFESVYDPLHRSCSPLYCGGLQILHGVSPLDFAALKVMGTLLLAKDRQPSVWYFAPVFVP